MIKKVTFTAILFFLLSVAYGQTKKDSVIVVPQGKFFDLDKQDEKTTTNKAKLKGEIHIVYATAKGKLYIKLVSNKTGKEYRRYIKQDVD